MRKQIVFALVAILMAIILPVSAGCNGVDPDKPFYEGKTLTILVPFSAGGGTDIYARLIGANLGDYIPGNPTIVVENLVGAGGAICMQYLENSAEPDGLTIAVSASGVLTRWLKEEEGHDYNLPDMKFLGAAPASCVAYAGAHLGASNMSELVALNTTIYDAHTQLAGTYAVVSRHLAQLFNIEIEQLSGYSGLGEIKLAILSGEADTTLVFDTTYSTEIKPFEEDESLVLLWQSGIFDEDGNLFRSPRVPHVPLVSEVYQQIYGEGPSGELWEAAEVCFAISVQFSSWIVAPAGTPEERVEELRAALLAMSLSPAYQEDAIAVLGTEDLLVVGDAGEATWVNTLETPKEVIEFALT